jgi:general stress protein 26
MTTQAEGSDRATGLKKLVELVKDIDFCMLTTVDESGDLHSRPMSTNGEADADGDLWFFTTTTSLKVKETDRTPKVNVSFAAPGTQRYVSVTGTAQLVRDQAKMKELWKPQLKAWFPKGLEDPEIALLKMSASKAEYWDSHVSPVSHVIGLVKALVTGERAQVGEHESITLGK